MYPSEIKDAHAWIIIPVHNRKELTLSCLHHLKWVTSKTDWSIVIANDGSTDGTAEAIKKEFPDVHVIHGNGSWYWTGAIAAGMRYAMEHNATEIVWLNDDTIPEKGSLMRIVDLVRHDDHLMVASTAMHAGRQVVSCSMKFHEVTSQAGKLTCVDVLAGYQIAFSSKVVNTIGLPDWHRWPHYAGDSSYTRKACHAGFKLRLDGDSHIELKDFRSYPAIGEVFWQHDNTPAQRIQKVFISKKSPFRLISRWHLDVLSRGYLHGGIVFIGRSLSWIADIAKSYHKKSGDPYSINL